MVTKRLYLQIGAQKKARFFSLMYFCESLCINRISHNYVIPQLVFCIIMPFRTSFHIPFRKLIPPFTLTDNENGLLACVAGGIVGARELKFWRLSRAPTIPPPTQATGQSVKRYHIMSGDTLSHASRVTCNCNLLLSHQNLVARI